MAVGQGPEQGQGFGYAQTAAEPKAVRQDISDESPIRDEIGALNAGIDRLIHQIERLRAKLDPVLHFIPESENPSMGLAQEPRSQFTEELARARMRVNEAADQVIRTLDQLDV